MTDKRIAGFVLENFLPYRLSVLSNTVSNSVSTAYTEKHGLTKPEWRTIAILNRFPGIAAREVAQRTAMDKVQVSRAVSSLLKAGRIRREFSTEDQRRSVLSLTPQGKAVFAKVLPAALQYETLLRDSLTEAENKALDRLLTKLQHEAVVVQSVFQQRIPHRTGDRSAKSKASPRKASL